MGSINTVLAVYHPYELQLCMSEDCTQSVVSHEQLISHMTN